MGMNAPGPRTGQQPAKPSGGDADDREGGGPDREGGAEPPPPAAIARLPECVCQHRHRRPIGRTVLDRGEVPAQRRWRIEEAEEAGAHDADAHFMRLRAYADGEVLLGERGGASETGRPARQIDVARVLHVAGRLLLATEGPGEIDAMRGAGVVQ